MTARILVVDDVPANVKLLEVRLLAEYFEVLTANNGPDALEICEHGKVDVMLLDVMMPQMDGFEVCRRLKNDPATSHIPVIMITALDQISDRVRGLEAGADDFLTKPVNDLQLMTRVKSLVRLKMLTDELRLRASTTRNIGIEELLARRDPAAEAKPCVLLIDERPEEVTEMEMANAGEVIASSFDHGAARHVAVAEMTLERARRRVELGEDVVIILDSLTRLARAYNNIDRGSGRTLSGGIGAEAMERPKRFFGSARAVDPRVGKGSLTIIATALIDTGSKADEVIFEEFKGTGNAEIVLSRELAERRIFPAIDVSASGTRREELLLDPKSLERAHALRQATADLPTNKQIEVVRELLQRGI